MEKYKNIIMKNYFRATSHHGEQHLIYPTSAKAKPFKTEAVTRKKCKKHSYMQEIKVSNFIFRIRIVCNNNVSTS